jgi:hypothetical protein
MTVFQTESLRGGKRLFALPHETGKMRDPTRDEVVNAFGMMCNLDKNAKQLESDPTLSDKDRARYRSEGSSAIRNVLRERVLPQLDKEAAEFRAKRQAILTPPPLAPTDYTSAIRDKEIRDAFSKMEPDRRARELSALANGSRPDVVEALARSPVPGDPLAVAALGIFQATATKQNAAELRELDQFEEGLTNHRAVVDTIHFNLE